LKSAEGIYWDRLGYKKQSVSSELSVFVKEVRRSLFLRFEEPGFFFSKV